MQQSAGRMARGARSGAYRRARRHRAGGNCDDAGRGDDDGLVEMVETMKEGQIEKPTPTVTISGSHILYSV